MVFAELSKLPKERVRFRHKKVIRSRQGRDKFRRSKSPNMELQTQRRFSL